MELKELLELNQSITNLGRELYETICEIDRLTGLVYAMDSEFDQTIIDMGTMLKNEAARKASKDLLRTSDYGYMEYSIKLTELKHLKLKLSYERSSLESELSLHILDIKRTTAKTESENMTIWVDQTNYIELVKQTEMFSN